MGRKEVGVEAVVAIRRLGGSASVPQIRNEIVAQRGITQGDNAKKPRKGAVERALQYAYYSGKYPGLSVGAEHRGERTLLRNRKKKTIIWSYNPSRKPEKAKDLFDQENI